MSRASSKPGKAPRAKGKARANPNGARGMRGRSGMHRPEGVLAALTSADTDAAAVAVAVAVIGGAVHPQHVTVSAAVPAPAVVFSVTQPVPCSAAASAPEFSVPITRPL